MLNFTLRGHSIKSRAPFLTSAPSGSTRQRTAISSPWMNSELYGILKSGVPSKEHKSFDSAESNGFYLTPGVVFSGANPVIKATAIKSQLRQIAAIDLALEKIAADTGVSVEDIRLKFKDIFINLKGGKKVDSIPKNKADWQKRAREKNPIRGLFGAGGPEFTPGALIPSDFKASFDGEPLGMDVFVRHDPLGREEILRYADLESIGAELQERESEEKTVSDQMLTSPKCFIPEDTEFSSTLQLLQVTDVEAGMFVETLRRFIQNPYLGACRAQGFGGAFEADWEITQVVGSKEISLGMVSDPSDRVAEMIEAWWSSSFDYVTPGFGEAVLSKKAQAKVDKKIKVAAEAATAADTDTPVETMEKTFLPTQALAE